MSTINTSQQVQINLTIDSLLKQKTLRKVKKEGITLKALVTMAMKAYLNNRLVIGAYSENDSYDAIFADQEIVAKANKLGKLLQAKSL